MTSILDGLTGHVTPAFISNVSAQTGESNAAISKALSAVLPAFLSSIADRSSDSGFMAQLNRLAAGAGAEGSGWTTASAALVPGLFGNRLSSITDAVARFAGIRPASAASLLVGASPLVLGYLGRLINRDHLNVNDLGRKLREERQAIASAMPGGFEWAPPEAGSVAAARLLAEADRGVDSRMRRTLLAILGGLVLVGLLWFLGRNRTSDIQTGTANLAQRTAAAVARTLPGGGSLRVYPGSLEDRMIGYLAAPAGNSDVFAFDRIGFQTGSASLTPESREQLRNVATILKAYPAAAVAIEGHTDDVGDAGSNMSLSAARASAVFEALRAEGVTNPTTSQGYGSTRPVADNATEAGRASNRRVALRITSPDARDRRQP